MKPLKMIFLLTLLVAGLLCGPVSAQDGTEAQTAPAVQVEVPDVQVEMPQVQVPDVNVQAEVPDVNVQAPAAAPDVQLSVQERADDNGAGVLFWSVGIVALVLFGLAIGMMFSDRGRRPVQDY